MLGAIFARLGRRWRRAGAHHDLGTRGEIEAERHMRGLGCRVLARNARTARGEVDLVLEESGGGIVVVEVKTRVVGGGENAHPGELAVDREKRRRLVAITEHLRRANGWLDRPIRIDIVVVEFCDSGVRIRHLRDAVRGG